MSLYGTEYFIDNTMALEEAFNNELNNFNIMMESFNNNNIKVIYEGAIIDKIKELWDKFIRWFKKKVREINISIMSKKLKTLKIKPIIIKKMLVNFHMGTD